MKNFVFLVTLISFNISYSQVVPDIQKFSQLTRAKSEALTIEENLIWFIDQPNGLQSFNIKDQKIEKYSLPFSQQFFTALYIDSSGNKWIGTEQGVILLWNNEVKKIFNNADMCGAWITSIKIDVNNDLWYSTLHKGIGQYNGKEWKCYNTENSPIISNVIYDFEFDLEGNIWFASDSGLIKYDKSNWTIFNSQNSGLPSNTIFDLCFDGIKYLWIGTEKGLARLNVFSELVFFEMVDGVSDPFITGLNFDKNGIMWVGTASALESYYKGQWKVCWRPKIEDEFSAPLVSHIQIDYNNNIWFLGFGLSVYNANGILLK